VLVAPRRLPKGTSCFSPWPPLLVCRGQIMFPPFHFLHSSSPSQAPFILTFFLSYIRFSLWLLFFFVPFHSFHHLPLMRHAVFVFFLDFEESRPLFPEYIFHLSVHFLRLSVLASSVFLTEILFFLYLSH